MGLSKKTFLYSIILATVMVGLITGYFVLMLPSLYVNYVMESNLNAVVDIHKGYIEQHTYDHLAVRNPSATYSVEIPKKGTSFFIVGKFFQLSANIQDPDLQLLFDQLRTNMNTYMSIYTQDSEEVENANEITAPYCTETNTSDNRSDILTDNQDYTMKNVSALWDVIKEKFLDQQPQSSPIVLEIERKENQGIYRQEYSKIHAISDKRIIYETGISDENYGYTTYIAIDYADDAYIFTVLPTMTPRMEEITPVVFGSMPMIIAVVFLLVLLSSHYFSGKIVHPIIHLANYANQVSLGYTGFVTDFSKNSNDEIADLGKALQELYQKLDQKNQFLKEENTRQEVFLRATSHQLKTPIAAALLLVEGMIHKIGKYKNTEEFLPEVKKQLLSMRKIVEDVLHLNYHAAQIEPELLSVEILVQELIASYTVQIADKQLVLDIQGSATAYADRELLKKIVDNLLSNAVQYTPQGEHIYIHIAETSLCIRNYGINIDPSLLPNIFEPFVSSDETHKGKGLGLYVAAYYSRLLGIQLHIENKQEDTLGLFVQSKLIF